MKQTHEGREAAVRGRADGGRLGAISAGLADAGLASLATLGVGLFAARNLTSSEFGTFALFFAGFALAGGVATQLVFAPAEFATIAWSRVPAERLDLVRQTWRLGTPCGLAAAAVVVIVALVLAGAPAAVAWALATTTAACAVMSPLQDHVRRLLHFGGASWCAALTSLVQLGVIALALALLALLDVGRVWRPLSALAVANAASLAVGMALAHHRKLGPVIPVYPIRRLVRSGRWFLMGEMSVTGASFISAAFVSRLVGPEVLGQTEAARLVASPLFMLIAGLNMALAPRSAAAAGSARRAQAARIARSFRAVLAVGGIAYGAGTAVSWPGNPFGSLLPQAYARPGLVLATVLAYVMIGLPFPQRAELVGAGRERLLPRSALQAGALQCIAAGSAVWIGAFARPLGVAVFGAAASLGYQRQRRAIYLDERPEPPSVTLSKS